MTTRERVLASRLIQKIDNNESYARQMGLSCTMSAVGTNKDSKKPQYNYSIKKSHTETSKRERIL